MNRAIISQRITSILAEIERLNNALYAMNTTDIQRYPDNYEVLSTDAALRAERITCRLRHLIYATTSIKKEEYLRSAETMQGIEISENDGILEIKLPCLLPKRRQRQSTEFLLDPFTSALSDYAAHHTMPQFQHCVVCFSHIYAQELPERRVVKEAPNHIAAVRVHPQLVQQLNAGDTGTDDGHGNQGLSTLVLLPAAVNAVGEPDKQQHQDPKAGDTGQQQEQDHRAEQQATEDLIRKKTQNAATKRNKYSRLSAYRQRLSYV